MRHRRICGDVLMVPMMMQGHLNPLMNAGKKLMERGISITVLILKDSQDLIAPYLKVEENRVQGLLHVHVVSDKKVKAIDNGIWGSITSFEQACEPFLEALLAEQAADGVGPKCIIADQFMGWTQSWANKLNIARYVAVLSPAAFGYFMYNHSSLIDRDEDSVMKVVDSCDLTPAPMFITQSGDTFGEAAGILFNTFYELESHPINALQAQLAADCSAGKQVPKTLAIGPMVPAEFIGEESFTAADDDSECILWLNTRPASSVLYVAFGSWAYLSPDEIRELAFGLEASNQSFLWVLRVEPPKQGSMEGFNEMEAVTNLLPPGFQARTKDQGYIYTKFAPQLAILSNPATAGFLTHCGWNSSLESLCRGIPMIGWPMTAEQRLCCRVLVDSAKVAVELRIGLQHHELVGRGLVEKAISRLLTQPEGKQLKHKARVLQRQAREAMSPKGSSQASFDFLVKDIQSR